MGDGYYSETELGVGFLSFFLLIMVISLIFAAALYVVMSFALMTFFRKVGVESWIAWVPIYNNWKWLEVGGMKGWLALIALIPYGGLVTSVFLYIGMYRTGIAFRKSTGFLVLGIFFPFVWAFILGGRNEVYEPQLITQAGFPPPRAGYGSIPPGAPYVAGYAQGGYAPYPGPPAPGAPAGYDAAQYAAPTAYGSAPGYMPPAPAYTAPPAYAPPPAYVAPTELPAPSAYAPPPAYEASQGYASSPAYGVPAAPSDGVPVAPAAPTEPVPPVAPAPPAPPTNVVPPIPPIPPAN